MYIPSKNLEEKGMRCGEVIYIRDKINILYVFNW